MAYYQNLVQLVVWGSSIIRRFDNPKVLSSFPIYVYGRWLNLHISSQLAVRVTVRVRVSENACCSMHLRTSKPSDYGHTTCCKACTTCNPQLFAVVEIGLEWTIPHVTSSQRGSTLLFHLYRVFTRLSKYRAAQAGILEPRPLAQMYA